MAERGGQGAAGPSVVITGAAGGIGSALARRFARTGARIGLLDRDRAGVDAMVPVVRELGGAALPVPCDVTRWDDCQTAIRTVLAAHGGIDVLVNNAGITHLSVFADTEVAVLRTVMDINFFGAVYCTKAALPSLVERRGTVVVLSSIAGFSPLAGRCGYAASKHALHGLFESLRAELRRSGVHVMMVCPGFTDTGIGRNALGGDGGPARAARTTVGKAADPNDVAEAIHRGIARRRRMLVLSPVGKLALVFSRVMPGVYERLMARQLLLESPPRR